MNAKTKIIVLRMKQLIYTGILAVAAILLLLLLFSVFASDKNNSSTPETDSDAENPSSVSVLSTAAYIPGVYTTELILNDQSVEIEVIVDHTSVTSLRLVNLSESITTLYPLLEPAFLQLRDQIYETQSLDTVTYNSENKYTTLVLLEAIKSSLEKATPDASS